MTTVGQVFPHPFQGRRDRDCEHPGCGRPDRNPIHHAPAPDQQPTPPPNIAHIAAATDGGRWLGNVTESDLAAVLAWAHSLTPTPPDQTNVPPPPTDTQTPYNPVSPGLLAARLIQARLDGYPVACTSCGHGNLDHDSDAMHYDDCPRFPPNPAQLIVGGDLDRRRLRRIAERAQASRDDPLAADEKADAEFASAVTPQVVLQLLDARWPVDRVAEWLRIRAKDEVLDGRLSMVFGNDVQKRQVLTQLVADVEHSSLLLRLLSGVRALSAPPLLQDSYPVYPPDLLVGDTVETRVAVTLDHGTIREGQRGVVSAVSSDPFVVGFDWVDAGGSHTMALEAVKLRRVVG